MDVSKSMKGLEIEYVEISALPFLNTDLEVNGTFPPVVEAFRQKILAADSVLFASPEYNYSVTGTQHKQFTTLCCLYISTYVFLPCSISSDYVEYSSFS